MNCIPKTAYILISYHCRALPSWTSCPCQRSCPMKVDGWICLELLSVQSWYHPLNSSLQVHANILIQFFFRFSLFYIHLISFFSECGDDPCRNRGTALSPSLSALATSSISSSSPTSTQSECSCQCDPSWPVYREDRKVCIDSVHGTNLK